ncbi:MAG: D-alanine--D-alanine ligase family protein [Pseudobdellovibrionaceae bacterium]
MKKTIALVFGGRSAEHAVSIRSARSLLQAIDKNLFQPLCIGISQEGFWYHLDEQDLKSCDLLLDAQLPASAQPVALIPQRTLLYLKTNQSQKIDGAFPIVHGTFGEDGTLQGLFKSVDLPFVGCDVLASAIGMDKDFMKQILSSAKIQNSPGLVLRKEDLYKTADWKTAANELDLKKIDSVYEKLANQLGLPFFIKPANAGSSVGVHKIKSAEDFTVKIQDSFLFDHKVLAEKFIRGRELECSVLGLGTHIEASLPGEVIPQHDFYSYEAKYLDDKGALLKIPAELSQQQTEKLQQVAIATYKALGCQGFTRVDFFMTADDQVYVNEVNTLPGFTSISMYPKMWEASGLPYNSLITKLIDLAFVKYDLDKNIKIVY